MFGLGRIQLYIIAGVFVFGVLTTGYYQWRKGIEREALLEYNQKQLEQTIADQADFKRKMDVIQKEQDEILAKNKVDRQAFDDKMKSADSFLNSKETKTKDRPSSDILKKTIDKLKDAPK